MFKLIAQYNWLLPKSSGVQGVKTSPPPEISREGSGEGGHPGRVIRANVNRTRQITLPGSSTYRSVLLAPSSPFWHIKGGGGRIFRVISLFHIYRTLHLVPSACRHRFCYLWRVFRGQLPARLSSSGGSTPPPPSDIKSWLRQCF